MYRLCAITRPKRPEMEQGLTFLCSENLENKRTDLENYGKGNDS